MRTPSLTAGPTTGVVVALAGALLVLSAATAFAHPSWRPNEVPAGGPVEVELFVPHACAADGGEPADGDEVSPITLVAVPVTATFRIQPRPVDGFEVEVDDEVAQWLATGPGSDGELSLPAILEVDGDVGDVLPIPVFQECANGEFFRWSATGDQEGDPAVNLTIAEGTPAPLPSELLSRSPAATPSDATPTEPTPPPTTATPTPSPSATTSPTPSPSVTPSATADPSPEASAAADEDDGSFPLVPVLVGVVVVVALLAAAAVRSSRKVDPDNTADDAA